MRAEFIDEADAALAVAKTNEAFAEQPDTHRRAVGLGQFAREKRRDPVSAQHVTHRGSGPGPRHELVVFACQHGCAPFLRRSMQPPARPTATGTKRSSADSSRTASASDQVSCTTIADGDNREWFRLPFGANIWR